MKLKPNKVKCYVLQPNIETIYHAVIISHSTWLHHQIVLVVVVIIGIIINILFVISATFHTDAWCKNCSIQQVGIDLWKLYELFNTLLRIFQRIFLLKAILVFAMVAYRYNRLLKFPKVFIYPFSINLQGIKMAQWLKVCTDSLCVSVCRGEPSNKNGKTAN